MIKLNKIKTLKSNSVFSDLLSRYATLNEMFLLLKVDKELIKQLKKDVKEWGYTEDVAKEVFEYIDQLEPGKTYHVWEFIDEVEEVEVKDDE